MVVKGNRKGPSESKHSISCVLMCCDPVLYFYKTLPLSVKSTKSLLFLTTVSKSAITKQTNKTLNAPVYKAASLTVARRCKSPKCPSKHEWINTVAYMDTMEHHPALMRKEFLTHATLWANLEENILRETGQTQKDTCCVIPLMHALQGEGMVGARAGGVGDMGNDYQMAEAFQLGEVKKLGRLAAQ